ncbi:MAG: S9 family peptidase [Bacteroidales bacterium]|jgi:dipeptidyl-peptidase-4
MKKILTIIIACTTILCSLHLNGQEKQKLTFDDFFKNYTFQQKSVYGLRSMNDGIHYTTSEGGRKIVKHSFKTGEEIETILNLDSIENNIRYFQNYSFNDDETKILLTTNINPIYRRSYTAEYFIYDTKVNSIVKLSDGENQQLATFSPTENKVAFVRENNLFVKDFATGLETQITNDGEYNNIINGAPDWVYEEEFMFSKAFSWSPDGKKIAYMKFDESNVKLYGLLMYKGTYPTFEENALYPEYRTYKYPKAGEDNSIVTVHIYDIETQNTINVDIGPEKDQYIPRIRWTKDNNTLSVFRVNRLQNKFELLFADANTGNSKVVFTEENKYYIDESIYDNITFLDKNNFITTSERDGNMHLYLFNTEKSEIKQITNGNWEVTEFLGYDADNNKVYYMSNEGSPLINNLYSININKNKKERLTKGDGSNHSVFSKGFKYFINYFSNVTTPNYVTLHESNGKLIRVLEDNKEYLDQINKYNYNNKEFFTFVTSNNDTLNGYIIKPINFDSNKKYPVLMTQYSGPGSQQVVNRWSFDWYTYLSSEGFLVACVDPRGTGGRGEDFKKCTYLQLGKYESDDQIEAANYLAKLPYVDENNIAIWGWSYGGFMVSLCLEKGNGIFNSGVAIAPVTNWRYYDNIYTERFMRTPQENPNGYDDNSPITHAEDLQGKLLLIHGLADDNVHPQNSIEFAEKLVQANKQFDFMLYNNRNHGIYGGNTSYHLYLKVTNFLKENLFN